MGDITALQPWHIGVALGIIAFTIVGFFYIIKKYGVSIETKQGQIFIDHKKISENPDSPTTRLYGHMMEILSLIRRVYYENYLKMLVRAGVDKSMITTCEDTLYFTQVQGNIIYSGNGIYSSKTIIETELATGDYYQRRESDSYNQYIQHVVDLLLANRNKYLDTNYHNNVLQVDGKIRTRIVDRVSLYDAEEKIKTRIAEYVKSIFDYAKNC